MAAPIVSQDPINNIVDELGSDEARFDTVVTEFCRNIPYPLRISELHAHCVGLSLEFLKSRDVPVLTCERVALMTWQTLSPTLDTQNPPTPQEGESGDTADDWCIESDVFTRHVFQCLLKACQTELRTSPDPEGLPTPPPIHPSNISQHSIRNSRRKMEDKHVCLHTPAILHSDNTTLQHQAVGDGYSLFCVFDGHGGNEASLYAYHEYSYHLVNSPHYPHQMSQAVTEAFSKTETGVLCKAKQCNFRGGSCAAVCVLSSSELHVGWLGDCQLLLVSDDLPVKLTPPHKPDNEEERLRIESVGGCVVFFNGWRVNGSIAVARAIGDKDFKPFIGAEPDTVSRPLSPCDQAIILACDGLFDNLPTDEIMRIVLDNSCKSGRDTVAQKLVGAAKDYGSTDNITVIVIWLNVT